MAGTPVLASRVGSFPEYVIENVTGEFVDSFEDYEAILFSAEKIRSQLSTYVDRCRKMFANTFYYKANFERFGAIIESTQNAGGSDPR
jgi:glycosyltransferase involved in cell wall biosynthesis